MATLDRIEMLIKNKGWNKSEFSRRLGLPTNVFGEWRRGKHLSYLKHIDKIAELLDTTKEYILCETDNPSKMIVIDDDAALQIIIKAVSNSAIADDIKDMDENELKAYTEAFIQYMKDNSKYIKAIARENIEK